MQLVLVAVVFGLGWWTWPEGLLETEFRDLTLGAVLWAVLASVVYVVGVLMLYFVLVEPIRAFIKGWRSAGKG
jgi:hypothetical protein